MAKKRTPKTDSSKRAKKNPGVLVDPPLVGRIIQYKFKKGFCKGFICAYDDDHVYVYFGDADVIEIDHEKREEKYFLMDGLVLEEQHEPPNSTFSDFVHNWGVEHFKRFMGDGEFGIVRLKTDELTVELNQLFKRFQVYLSTDRDYPIENIFSVEDPAISVNSHLGN